MQQLTSSLAGCCNALSHTNDYVEIPLGSSAQDRHKSLRKTKTSHVQSMERRHWTAHNHQCCQFWAPFPSFEWKKPVNRLRTASTSPQMIDKLPQSGRGLGHVTLFITTGMLLYLWNCTSQRHSYNGRLIGNEMWPIIGAITNDLEWS